MSKSQIDAKLEEHRMTKHCPSCGNKLDCKSDWVGLPAGVKFDPTDQELIEHLEAKVKEEGVRSHPLIDEFIPTIEGEDGICYTHPEKLPGVTRDGLSKHFFHRPSKAYTTGTRKRRKIQTECDLQRSGDTRWHKTGKTRPVMLNGIQKGCKKILVLYTNFGKHRKPEKTNWVMHQYHLGELEEEKEGELVVSKIFYQTQPRQCNWSERKAVTGEVVVENNRRDSTGSGSCSSKEAMSQQRIDEAGISGYSGNIELHHQQHMKHDNFSFSPFRKSFEETGIGEVPSKAREIHEEQRELHHRPQAGQAASYLVSRPPGPISTIISPQLQHTSVVLDDPYHVPNIILQPKFQNQSQHQQQKLDRRSTSGLEEVILGCTSSGVKGEASIPQTQEPEWQYPYWSLDNPDHHG
ncbi:hypothetical protein LUZ60_009323 [Juncus effusus]|nr:hypothetical protein LUZ60_009323 [Juncus effusus]